METSRKIRKIQKEKDEKALKETEAKRDKIILTLSNLIQTFTKRIEHQEEKAENLEVEDSVLAYPEFTSEEITDFHEVTNEMFWEAELEEGPYLRR